MIQENQTLKRHVFKGAVHGVFWTYLSFMGSKVLVFISTMILARLLAPSQFGQIAFALLVINYLDTIGNLGVGPALIYEQERVEEAADVSFFISVAMGTLWFLFVLGMAPFAARFFRDPSVTPILRVLACGIFINALGSTHDAFLRRELAFKRRLIPDFASAFTKGIFSVVLAWLGAGVWSLVGGQLIGAAVSTIAVWLIVPWRPRWRFAWEIAGRMLRYGSQIVSVNILSAVVHHVDFLIVGRMLGSAALGFYSLAYRIPDILLAMLMRSVNNVMFPAYSKLQKDPVTLQRAFLATLRYLSLLTIPVGTGLAVLGSAVIFTLYGKNWTPAIPVLQALALSECVRSLGTHAGDVYKATGRPGILTKLATLRTIVLVPSLIFAARFGIAGVAMAQLVVTAASTALTLFIASRILGLPLKSILIEFKPGLLGSLAMVVSLGMVLPFLSGWPQVLSLVLAAGMGAAVYFFSAWVLNRETLMQARTVLASSLGKAGG